MPCQAFRFHLTAIALLARDPPLTPLAIRRADAGPAHRRTHLIAPPHPCDPLARPYRTPRAHPGTTPSRPRQSLAYPRPPSAPLNTGVPFLSAHVGHPNCFKRFRLPAGDYPRTRCSFSFRSGTLYLLERWRRAWRRSAPAQRYLGASRVRVGRLVPAQVGMSISRRQRSIPALLFHPGFDMSPSWTGLRLPRSFRHL